MKVKLQVLLASDIVFTDKVLMKVSDPILHILEKGFDAIVIVLIVADISLF